MATNFGTKLQFYLRQLGMKNATLARALQYDVSYISKWVSGKSLPSEKNASAVCIAIGERLAKIRGAAVILGTAPDENLPECIARELMEAYALDRKTLQTAEVVSIPILTEETLFEVSDIQRALRQSECQMICVVDYFALNRENRLTLSGIQAGRFALLEKRPGLHYRMAISPPEPESPQDAVYDAISLIHMLTGLSQLDFSLYKDTLAKNRFMLTVKDQYRASAMHMGRKGHWAAFCKDTDAAGTVQFYQALEARLGSDDLVFRSTDMPGLLKSRGYVQSVISTETRWLLGHLTEHILPEDVFSECLAQTEKDPQTAAEMRSVHLLTRGVLETCNVKMMIYDSSFTNLVITGEIDFFNQPIILTLSQRIRVMESLIRLTERTQSVRVIRGGFSPDFQYITNPCMFLSDGICYLRLENGAYKNNLLILNDYSIKQMFDCFFSTVWERREDVVVKDFQKVIELMTHYLDRLRLLPET